tara:strand:+ start:523 stop:1398 length:876 start_codon:yes stop_codon:yes gene_type:complete
MKQDRIENVAEDHADVRTYVPDERYSTDSIQAIRALFNEIMAYRAHVANMFGSEFRASYRGTVFGVFWNFVLPLIPITVYILLVNLRVFPRHDGLNPAIFIGYNVTIWALMRDMIQSPIQVIKSRNKDAMKTSQPISVSIVASFARLCFDTLVRLALVAVLVTIFGDWPHPNILGFAFVLLVGLAFSLSLGLIFGIFNVIVPDVSRVVSIVLQYGIFMSGVIFPLSSLGPLVVLEKINPFALVIKATREYLFFGAYPDFIFAVFWACVAFVSFLISMRFFYVMERRIRAVA